jgi:hypothetical protein
MKKILAIAACVLMSLLVSAQNMRTEEGVFPRTKAEIEQIKEQEPELVLLAGYKYEDNALYAAPDPDKPGEILLFFRADNHHYEQDELYIVFDKEGCLAMRASLQETLRVMKKWGKIAVRNKVTNYEKAMDIPYPKVNVYWRRTEPRFRKVTYWPLFMWAGKEEWLCPEFSFARTSGHVCFRFQLQDVQELPQEVIQPVEIWMFDYNIKDYLKWLDYDKLKALYVEKTPDRSKWDELFK